MPYTSQHSIVYQPVLEDKNVRLTSEKSKQRESSSNTLGSLCVAGSHNQLKSSYPGQFSVFCQLVNLTWASASKQGQIASHCPIMFPKTKHGKSLINRFSTCPNSTCILLIFKMENWMSKLKWISTVVYQYFFPIIERRKKLLPGTERNVLAVGHWCIPLTGLGHWDTLTSKSSSH